MARHNHHHTSNHRDESDVYSDSDDSDCYTDGGSSSSSCTNRSSSSHHQHPAGPPLPSLLGDEENQQEKEEEEEEEASFPAPSGYDFSSTVSVLSRLRAFQQQQQHPPRQEEEEEENAAAAAAAPTNTNSSTRRDEEVPPADDSRSVSESSAAPLREYLLPFGWVWESSLPTPLPPLLRITNGEPEPHHNAENNNDDNNDEESHESTDPTRFANHHDSLASTDDDDSLSSSSSSNSAAFVTAYMDCLKRMATHQPRRRRRGGRGNHTSGGARSVASDGGVAPASEAPDRHVLPKPNTSRKTWLCAMALLLVVVVAGIVGISAALRGGKDAPLPASFAAASPGAAAATDSNATTTTTMDDDDDHDAPTNSTTTPSKWDGFDGVAEVKRNFSVVETLPHDPTAFCQGLDRRPSDGFLVESTGMYGESLVRIYDPFALEGDDKDNNNGLFQPVVAETKMDPKYFGEGLCRFTTPQGEERYLQITWKSRTAFVYDADLNVVDSFEYSTSTKEGWGVTWDPTERVFYVSDGSEVVSVWNDNFEEIRSFRVTLLLANNKNNNKNKNKNGDEPSFLRRINELEWDPAEGGTLLANVWYQNAIVRIQPTTGTVLEAYDLTTLYPPAQRAPKADVLNGIAPSGQPGRWWITGKYWPHLFLVDLA